MGILAEANFETGDMSEFPEGYYGLTDVQSEVKRFGNYAMHIKGSFVWGLGGGGGALMGPGGEPLTSPTLYVRFYWYPAATPGDYPGSDEVCELATYTKIPLYLKWTWDRRFFLGSGLSGDTLLQTTAGQFPLNQWYCLEIYFDSTSQSWGLKVDSDLVLSGSGTGEADPTRTNLTYTCEKVGFPGSVSTTADSYFDGIALADDDWIGPYIPPESSGSAEWYYRKLRAA